MVYIDLKMMIKFHDLKSVPFKINKKKENVKPSNLWSFLFCVT